MTAPKRHLSLFDSTNIIVGIIIGAAIYESTPLIAANVPQRLALGGWEWSIPGVWSLTAVWLLGGFLSLVGALCYAELATAYPQEGGDFVYLTRSFGRPIGFLFAWSQLWVVRPGSIGAMAFIFARYADRLVPLKLAAAFGLPASGESAAGASGATDSISLLVYACAAVVVLSAINVAGVREGKWTQNILTVAKVLGLGVITLVGLCYSAPAVAAPVAAPQGDGNFSLAMIFVLFAYGGWNEMAFVGAEVRNPNKNILRALLLGTVAVAVFYILASVAFVHALGFSGVVASQAVGADVLRLAFGDWADRLISVLIAVSALAAINGQIFTGSRIYYAMGREHRFYRFLGRWHPQWGTPVASLVVQAVIAVAIMIGFGTTKNGFQAMVIFTTPIFWLFLSLVGLAVFTLRRHESDASRPYCMPAFPLPPILFYVSCLFMVFSSLRYAIDNKSHEALWAVGFLLAGVILCWFDQAPKPQEESPRK
jgi:amino acid transporter